MQASLKVVTDYEKHHCHAGEPYDQCNNIDKDSINLAGRIYRAFVWCIAEGATCTVDLSTLELDSKEIAARASRHASMLPIPDYVINDEVRFFEPPAEALHMYFDKYEDVTWQDYENLILVDQELLWREKFYLMIWRAKLKELGRETPKEFLRDNDEMRFLMAHTQKLEETWQGMLDYQHHLVHVQAPDFFRYADFKPYLDAGIVYGY